MCSMFCYALFVSKSPPRGERGVELGLSAPLYALRRILGVLGAQPQAGGFGGLGKAGVRAKFYCLVATLLCGNGKWAWLCAPTQSIGASNEAQSVGASNEKDAKA